MSKINVVLATDANYLRYVEVTLKSLLAHNQNLSVFIMYTGDVSPEWGDRLKPYFEKRNIHFYVNLCKFSIVEFFYPSHEEENILNDMMGNGYLFRFEKVMKR